MESHCNQMLIKVVKLPFLKMKATSPSDFLVDHIDFLQKMSLLRAE